MDDEDTLQPEDNESGEPTEEPRTEEPRTEEPRTEEPYPLHLPTPSYVPSVITGDPSPTVTHDGGNGPADWPQPRFPDAIPGYELLELLGRGGLGSVYRARHLEFGVEVAIKLFMFRTEARAQRLVQERVLNRLGRVRHPNLASTYGLGEVGGYPYLVMELVAGRPLHHPLTSNGPFEIHQAAGLLEQAARGVGCLHACGILHRDIKPGNILIDEQRRARVTDFGLAMCLADESVALWPEDGMVVGTPHYMPPEQVRGETSHFLPALDIWALGATLHWMLTGSLLFAGASLAEVLLAVLHEEPPVLRARRPEVPPELEAIFRRCVERDPARRYPDANVLADDLHRFLTGEPSHPPRRPRPWWAFWRRD